RLARRARASSPRIARAHFYLAETLFFMGRRQEAMNELRSAAAADSLDELIAVNVIINMAGLDDVDEAIRVAERWRRLLPRATWPAMTEWYVRAASGRCAGSSAPSGGTDFG